MADKAKSDLFKVTLDGKETSIYFKRPSVDQLSIIDLEYRKMFAHAIKQGVMAEAEARKVYKNSGAWTDKDDKELSQLAENVAKLSSVLNEDDGTKGGERMVGTLATMRADLLKKISERTDLFYNTAEGLANEQRMHKFIEICCYRGDDDDPMFDNRNAYSLFSVEYKDVLSEIYKQAYYFEYGMPDDISQTWAEVQWLNKNKDKPINKTKAKRSKKKKVPQKTGE
jgi:hypothetical protein